MRSRLCLMMFFVIAPLAGCVEPSAPEKPPAISETDFCKIADQLFFETQEVADWLYENDRALLQGIVVHNEQVERICS